jgi:hypothetical protein
MLVHQCKRYTAVSKLAHEGTRFALNAQTESIDDDRSSSGATSDRPHLPATKASDVTAKRSITKRRNGTPRKSAPELPLKCVSPEKAASTDLAGLATVAEVTKQNISAISTLEHSSEGHRTRGEKLADLFASVVGSCPFIIIQSVILAVWVGLNLLAWSYKWDPYPFILLNLALSFQAAFASPIIMMSQNRQA